MSITFKCDCGRSFRVAESAAGRKGKCPTCGRDLTVPTPAPEENNPFAESLIVESRAGTSVDSPTSSARGSSAGDIPASRPGQALSQSSSLQPSRQATTPVVAGYSNEWRNYVYLLLLFTLIPLVVSTFQPHISVHEQLQQTVDAHPEMPDLAARINDMGEKIARGEAELNDLFNLLPGHKLAGALLPHESKAHWAMAFAAAACYLGFLMVAFPKRDTKAASLFFAGLFTATVGIVLLLAFQLAAAYSPVSLGMGGKAAIIMLIVRFIGYSYAAASNPDNGFFLSFVGFTMGVGLCEEVTKAIPLLFRIKDIPGQAPATWRTLLLWGMVSGAGFGIAEGIMYSGDHYNGVDAGGIYLVRFVSCVALHAVWAGSVGITMYNRRSWLDNAGSGWNYCACVVPIVGIAMILHGMYDTLLKQGEDGWALAIAMISFWWLIFQVETMRRKVPRHLRALAAQM